MTTLVRDGEPERGVRHDGRVGHGLRFGCRCVEQVANCRRYKHLAIYHVVRENVNIRSVLPGIIGVIAVNVDAAAAAWYLTGSEVVTGAVVGGTATIGGATVGGVATAGASVGAVIATGGAALVVMGAAAA